LWETVDTGSVPIAGEAIDGPDFVQQVWNDSVGLECPPSLLAVCSLGGHVLLYVELDDTQNRGGCFESGPGDDYTLKFRSFTQWIELTAVAVESGAWERADGFDGQPKVNIDIDWWTQAADGFLATQPADAQYPEGLEIGSEIQHWPEHWLTPLDLAWTDVHATGVTAVLSSIPETPSDAESSVTLAAQWRWVRRVPPGNGGIVELSDGDTRRRFLAPADVERYGGVHGSREFDIALYSPRDVPSEDPDRPGEPPILGEITAIRHLD
jgi:hypothetical protein